MTPGAKSEEQRRLCWRDFVRLLRLHTTILLPFMVLLILSKTIAKVPI